MRVRERDSERAREREREREWEWEREREWEWERERRRRERERERPNTKIRQKKLPRQFSRLLTPVPSLGFSRECPARDMWCFVAYVYNGKERERDGESTLQDHIIHNEMRTALHMCLPDNFFVCWHPATALSVFHGNVPQEIWWTFSLMGNQRVGMFSPKSEILFVLSLALIWCRNFQDRTIPVGGDTWPSFCRKEE